MGFIFCIYCACASRYYAIEKPSDVSSCFRSHSSEPMKAKKIFAVPRHPIKIGPRAYDGSRLVHLVLCFAKPVDHAVCRCDFGERTLFLGLILMNVYTMNFARFGRRAYHSFQSVYQVSRKEGLAKLLSSSRSMHSRRNNRQPRGKDTTTHVGIFANQQRAPFGDTKSRKGKQYASSEDE